MIFLPRLLTLAHLTSGFELERLNEAREAAARRIITSLSANIAPSFKRDNICTQVMCAGLNNSCFEERKCILKFQICYPGSGVCKCTSAISNRSRRQMTPRHLLPDSPTNNLVFFYMRRTPHKVTSWKWGAVPFGILRKKPTHTHTQAGDRGSK